jgi:hypothetical protein
MGDLDRQAGERHQPCPRNRSTPLTLMILPSRSPHSPRRANQTVADGFRAGRHRLRPTMPLTANILGVLPRDRAGLASGILNAAPRGVRPAYSWSASHRHHWTWRSLTWPRPSPVSWSAPPLPSAAKSSTPVPSSSVRPRRPRQAHPAVRRRPHRAHHEVARRHRQGHRHQSRGTPPLGTVRHARRRPRGGHHGRRPGHPRRPGGMPPPAPTRSSSATVAASPVPSP